MLKCIENIVEEKVRRTMSKKALIAMSGGVDSSVAALRMKAQGYDCIGVTMKLYDNESTEANREDTCCSADDIEDARGVAFRLGIPYYVVNYKDDFKKKVMDPFVNSYLQGCTPNPCIECNRHLKFEHLYRTAQELGCDVIVTGHYARITYADGQYQLRRAIDLSKDQSYVLYSLTQEQLAHTVFPLGELTKEQVRQQAQEYGLANSDKRDSQDICFVPDGNYKKFMEENYGICAGPGEFVSVTGEVLGMHQGYYGYTIGQRKGLGIAAKHPLYVVDIQPEKNRVVLGSNDDLFQSTLEAENFNWILNRDYEGELLQAKIRYRQQAQNACVKRMEHDRVQVVFTEPQRAITRGQAVVIYQDDVVIGGGTICRSIGGIS